MFKKLSRHFVLITSILFIIPFGFATSLFIKEVNHKILFTKKEINGLKLHNASFDLLSEIQKDTPSVNIKNIQDKVLVIDTLESDLHDIDIHEEWSKTKGKIISLLNKNDSSAENLKKKSFAINSLLLFMKTATTNSNLILDPESETYHTISIVSQLLPKISNELIHIYSSLKSQDQSDLYFLESRGKLNDYISEYKYSVEIINKNDPENKSKKIEPHLQLMSDLSKLSDLLKVASSLPDSKNSIQKGKENLIYKITEAYKGYSTHLGWHLQKRLKNLNFYRLITIMTLTSSLALCLTLILYTKKIAIKKEEINIASRTNAILATAADGIVTINSKGTIETFNTSAERIFGYSENEVIGKNVNVLMPEPYHSQHDAYINKHLTTGEHKIISTGREVLAQHKDGHIFPIDLNVNAFESDGGKMFVGSIKDITNRKIQEQTEKNYIARLELSENIAEIGFWEFNPKTQAVFWSNQIYKIHGVTMDEYTPSLETALNFYHPNDANFVRSELEKSFREKIPFNIRARIIRKNGETIHVLSRGRPTYNEQMELMSIVGIFQDITEQKKFENEIENHRENLENLVQSRTTELQTALNDSKIAEQAKSDFFANMSHELRTPLNSIIGMAQLIEKTDLSDDQTEMFGYIRASSTVLLKTVNDILDISKIEAKELQLEEIVFDVFDNLRGSVQSLMTIASEKNLTLTHNLKNLSQPIFGDPTRFARITTNLVANALRYTDEGSVQVTTSIEDHPQREDVINLTVSVVDTGIGISSTQIETIFDKFTQADSSITRRFGGTGLGLAITKDLVELMDGKIFVESEVGKGSTFTITIPFKKAKEEDLVEDEDQSLFIDNLDVYQNRIPVQNARFLLAEDHDMNQLFMRKLFDSLGVTHYRIVENGDLAVKEIQNNNYDIVLMDCHMPILSGYDATVKIRFLNDPFAASVPIIAMDCKCDARR